MEINNQAKANYVAGVRLSLALDQLERLPRDAQVSGFSINEAIRILNQEYARVTNPDEPKKKVKKPGTKRATKARSKKKVGKKVGYHRKGTR